VAKGGTPAFAVAPVPTRAAWDANARYPVDGAKPSAAQTAVPNVDDEEDAHAVRRDDSAAAAAAARASKRDAIRETRVHGRKHARSGTVATLCGVEWTRSCCPP
jgi:hypothetical protein